MEEPRGAVARTCATEREVERADTQGRRRNIDTTRERAVARPRMVPCAERPRAICTGAWDEPVAADPPPRRTGLPGVVRGAARGAAHGPVPGSCRRGPQSARAVCASRDVAGLRRGDRARGGHPDRVSRLVLYGGFARGWRVRARPREVQTAEAVLTLARHGWGTAQPTFRQILTSLFFPGASAELMAAFNELQRRTPSPENAARLGHAIGDFDVTAPAWSRLVTELQRFLAGPSAAASI